MLNTILFDLDGTLLPLDMDRFVALYFQEMGRAFADWHNPKELVESVWAGTEAMIANQGQRTNERIFVDTFMGRMPGVWEDYQDRFEAFYEEGFLKTKECARAIPQMTECIMDLKRKGYTMAVATNPLFPKRAVLHRLAWAGLCPEYFAYISHYEQNRFCKPGTGFFEEVLDALEKTPEQCIMVGNDVQEDLCAGKLGMETFLITDCMIHRTKEPILCTHQGTYKDFFLYAESLKPLL